MDDATEELAHLASTAGAEVIGKFIQKMNQPSLNHYLGKGKLDELIKLKDSLDFNTVIVDDELSPRQQQNLENALGVKIIDRSALILDIFARRAQTREGRLQVELAQHQYLLPRLAGQWRHLERLGSGIGTRGPGESQLETDKRLIRQKIQRLECQIETVRKHRALYRKQRRKSGIPVIALVGYTNAGKSTLLNALSNAGVLAENKLFSTLDPTTRRIILPDNRPILMTDTVGFIRKLPPTIVTAFRATLEELAEATLLLHVVDLTSHNAVEQCQTVENILVELGLADKPRITALNKIDLLPDTGVFLEEIAPTFASDKSVNTVYVSAEKGLGLNELLETIAKNLERTPEKNAVE